MIGRVAHRWRLRHAHTQDFLSIPELAMNPLGLRIIGLFDPEHKDEITFEMFCVTLNAFRPEASLAEKMDLTFRVYDNDNNGRIERSELYTVLKHMVGTNISNDQQLWKLCDKVIADSKHGRPPESAGTFLQTLFCFALNLFYFIFIFVFYLFYLSFILFYELFIYLLLDIFL